MNTLYVDKVSGIRRSKKMLESRLKVSISIKGKQVNFEGQPLDEYVAEQVLEAIGLGFDADTAVLLCDEDFLFEEINIKDHIGNKKPDVVRARLIGTHGKTKKTLSEISGCAIVIKDNIVGIIGQAEDVEHAMTAVINIIKGTKQTNMYKYLEKLNREKRKR